MAHRYKLRELVDAIRALEKFAAAEYARLVGLAAAVAERVGRQHVHNCAACDHRASNHFHARSSDDIRIRAVTMGETPAWPGRECGYAVADKGTHDDWCNCRGFLPRWAALLGLRETPPPWPNAKDRLEGGA